MHDIDLMLKLQLEGKQAEARAISDRIDQAGPDKLTDTNGRVTVDIWMRHLFNRGWFMLQEGRYQEGSQLLENGRHLEVYGSPPLKTTAPIFNPNQHDLNDKNIIVALEGGFGDEIIHARFAGAFKKMGANKVYLVASPGLHSLFSRIPGIDGTITRDQISQVPHDYWVPGFSAGWVSGHEFDENFPCDPYLEPKQDSFEQWSNIIKGDKIKIGIRWAGNPKFEHQQFRLFPPAFLTNLTKYKELQLYSLQRDNNVIDLPDGIIDLQHFLISWEDTAAAIANLDLVITSCTSVAHLSAAMGKETWVMVPTLPYHVWTPGSPDSDSSPYYKTARIYRQTAKDVWNPAFQKMYRDLEEKFKLNPQDLDDEDREIKRLHITRGKEQDIEGFENIDANSVDLGKTWPWANNSFRHITVNSVFEYIDGSKEDVANAVNEAYRVSAPGAIVELEFFHHRCDEFLADIDQKHLLTIDFFSQFDQSLLIKRLRSGIQKKLPPSTIDFEIVDVNLEFTPYYEKVTKSGSAADEDVRNAITHLNNVVRKVKVLLQSHKPPRHSIDEIEKSLSQ